MTGVFTNTTLSASALNDAINGFVVNAQTGTTYTLVAADNGKLVTLNNASPVTVTVPSATFSQGNSVPLLNKGAGLVTLTGAGVTINGTATLAQNESAALVFDSATVAYVVRGGLPKASVSASTGAPTTAANGSRTSYKWTGSGTVTLTAGLLDILVVGGGGAGNSRGSGAGNQASGGGGAGGYIYLTNVYVPAGTYTVTVGAGGAAAGAVGSDSALVGILTAVGGGCGDNSDRGMGQLSVARGGSGGGGDGNSRVGGAGVTGQGNTGGAGQAAAYSATCGAGGGGGASAVGTAGAASAGGAGGAGSSNTIINGGSVTYAGGGGGSVGSGTAGAGGSGGGGAGGLTTGTNGTANTGGGGGGAFSNNTPGQGGSGLLVLLIG